MNSGRSFLRLRLGMFLSALWLIFAGYAQEDITALEYYIDTDPGLGNGTPIAITQGQSINESFTVSTSALPPGYHVLVIRALNAHNRWSMYERRLFLIQDPSNNLGFPRPVEDIVAAEYYFDTDPGFGNGTPIATSGGALINESLNVNTSSLSAGYHILVVRVQNAQDRWSMHERRLFLIQDATNDLNFPRPVADITAAEYFIDTDPGLGNGTAIPTSGGALISESIFINTSSLGIGYHVVAVRTQNAEGRWSMYERRLFLIQDPSDDLGFPRPAEDIAAAEYFIDTDPGLGNGTAIPTSGGALVSESININTTGLGVGYHIIAVRTQNAEGRWSMYERRLFLVQDPTDDLNFPRPVSEIAAAEYFIDTDPGVGNGTEIPTVGGTIIGESMAIPTNGLTAGFHHIFVRTQNAEGRWSMYEKRRFLIQDPVDDLEFPPNKIVELEYFIDTDPGVGNGISISVDTPVRMLELTELMLSTGGVGVGMHTLFMRARNEVGIWSPEVSAPFEVVNVNSPSEVDSLALVQFYTELDGENWTNNTNWLAQDQRIANWFGITLNPSGSEVLEIQLSNNGLSNTLPIEVDELDQIETLDLSGNNIEVLESDLTALNNAITIDLSGNKLDFSDLEPVAGVQTLNYSNQQDLDQVIDQGNLIIRAGTDQTLTTTSEGTANLYQWTLDGANIAGATDPTYTISDMDRNKQGSYGVVLTSSIVDGLALNSPPIDVQGSAVISVNVTDGSGTPISENVNAYLFPLDQESADTVEFNGTPGILNVENSFSFPEVVFSNYLVAIETTVPLEDPNLRFVPTYYGDAVLSIEADTLFLGTDSTISVAMEGVPPESLGDGLVTGTIEEDFPEETERVDARRRAKKRKCGLRRRVSGGRTDQQEFELIAYGETNDNGEFEYGFLPSGIYQFFVEYPGIPIDQSAFVEFEIGEAGVSDTEFVLAVFATPEGISIEIVLGITTDYFVDFNIYPNPTTELINIEYAEVKIEDVVMELVNLEGKVLYRKQMDRSKRKMVYDTSLLSPGQYFVRFIGGGNEEPLVFKIVKK